MTVIITNEWMTCFFFKGKHFCASAPLCLCESLLAAVGLGGVCVQRRGRSKEDERIAMRKQPHGLSGHSKLRAPCCLSTDSSDMRKQAARRSGKDEKEGSRCGCKRAHTLKKSGFCSDVKAKWPSTSKDLVRVFVNHTDTYPQERTKGSLRRAGPWRSNKDRAVLRRHDSRGTYLSGQIC